MGIAASGLLLLLTGTPATLGSIRFTLCSLLAVLGYCACALEAHGVRVQR